MIVVIFKDGRYSLRRGFLFFEYYDFVDRRWGSLGLMRRYRRGFGVGTLEEATKVLELLTDVGTPV